ncbi:MAG: hypothetical protein U0V56_06195 [Actinomycetota bacterium]
MRGRRQRDPARTRRFVTVIVPETVRGTLFAYVVHRRASFA